MKLCALVQSTFAQLYGLALLERLPEDEQFYLCLDDTGLSP